MCWRGCDRDRDVRVRLVESVTRRVRSRVLVIYLSLLGPPTFKETRRWPLTDTATTSGDCKSTSKSPLGEFTPKYPSSALHTQLSSDNQKEIGG